MLAHYHGQTWNASEIGRSMGLSDKTVRAYLDILTETFMLRQLQPWQENLKKRQVKAPKVYFRDTGLLHNLLELGDFHSVSGHPRAGASWEGFALEQVLRICKPSGAYYWAIYGRAELDLFFLLNGKAYGVEFKYSEAPLATGSMHTAVKCLNLEKLLVVYPGKDEYPIDAKITVCPIHKIKKHL
jgi:predicted AAA+ superfamily ATPase